MIPEAALGAIQPANPGSYFAHFADGGGWRSEIVLRNRYSQSKPFRLEFRDDFGQRLMIPLPDGSTNWFVEGLLFPKATYFFESTGAGTRTRSGWARVSAPECAAFENAFANCGAGLDGVHGTLIFRNETRPGFSFESSIPLDSYENHSPVSFPFDNQNGKVSPFSVLKPFINTGERLRVNVSDENGGTVAEQFIDLAPRGKKLFCSPTFFRLPRIEEGPCGYQLKREQGL